VNNLAGSLRDLPEPVKTGSLGDLDGRFIQKGKRKGISSMSSITTMYIQSNRQGLVTLGLSGS
jgi:hypothetical protein